MYLPGGLNRRVLQLYAKFNKEDKTALAIISHNTSSFYIPGDI